MILVENVVGSSHDPEWQGRLDGAAVDHLLLDQWDAQKSRLRKATLGGVELALSLDRASHLHDGDILVWDGAARRAIVARIELNEVMVVEIEDDPSAAPETTARTLFELGHALGNQHWPAVVKGARIFVPLTVDRKVMASVMKTHAFPRIRYDFRPGVEVIPYMTPHEARRLFGGASAPSHAHGHGHSDGHAHDHASGADHAHDGDRVA